jgi:Uma2 family endonuclease
MTEVGTFTEPRPHLWTIEEYEALAAAGAFRGSGRIELIEGVILEMAPQQSIHSFLKVEIARRLANALDALGSQLRVYGDPTVRMSRDSAPEPDVAVTAEAPGFAFLTGDQVSLLVEIANTTVEHDLGQKAALYARNNTPEYWVLEVKARRIHRHWAPSDACYGQSDVVQLGDPCASVTIPALAIDTAGLI